MAEGDEIALKLGRADVDATLQHVAEEAFLGTSLLLISSCASDGCIEFIFLQGVDHGSGLQLVSGSIITRFLLHSSLVDAFLHAAHDEFGSEFLRQFITILDGFLEVMSCVDVQQREWNFCRIECLVGKICNHDRILATRKEDDWTLELGSYFAEYVDGFCLQFLEMFDSLIVHNLCLFLLLFSGCKGTVISPTWAIPHGV